MDVEERRLVDTIAERAVREGFALDHAQLRAAEVLAARGAHGVYLSGPVGRGKTWLLDAYFGSLVTQRKRRYHFHSFFADLHRGAHKQGSIDSAIASLVGDCEVLCFDELHVHDIGDAKLVAKVLEYIFGRQIRLVVTSNYRPDELLPNPLFHMKFLPTIASILRMMTVVAVDGTQDYRRTATSRAATGFAGGSYAVGLRNPRCGTIMIPVGGNRSVRAIAFGENDIRLTFDDLCGRPTGPADYVILAKTFKRWTIVGVPRLATSNSDAVARFCSVVDVLHDSAVQLSVEAELPLAEVLRGTEEVLDIGRAASRLYTLHEASPSSVSTA
ncbi:cell division protein ZapE [Antrihabitans sp. YC3-6]|uniref:Cell division protein ZapE n=1 Tax=Antrihabitans stalagmiti TaxID=2799499 RepID=A0A934U4D9_9NOCA|nr:cell division protein ZapE [Antrihabitans stalagmiti]MBJ8340277.1 cell division protein ZapE [Antrihabitans stalagmiti]